MNLRLLFLLASLACLGVGCKTTGPDADPGPAATSAGPVPAGEAAPITGGALYNGMQ